MQKSKSLKKTSSRILFLDYLRVFAFVSVLIGHKFYGTLSEFVSNPATHASPRYLVNLLLPFFEAGGAGIVVFFLISGYIITFVLQNELPRAFFIKRIFRIYPLYMAAVLLQVFTIWVMDGSLPKPSILIPQLLLIGDFFQTPYTLQGVEWTLRVEIFFYLFMGIARHFNLLHAHKKIFPFIILLSILGLGFLAPIPAHSIWSHGYLTIYAPFLLLGTLFYFQENKEISAWFLFSSVIFVLAQYYMLISIHQQAWVNSHFATFGVLLFFFAWRYRQIFQPYPLVLFLSNLTYSVYLFHNWSWDPIKKVFAKLSIGIINPDIQALLALLLLCTIMFNWVEKTGIRWGRQVLKKIEEKHPTTS